MSFGEKAKNLNLKKECVRAWIKRANLGISINDIY